MLSFFVKGLIIGVSIAAPVGPIAVLCINRTLHHGWKLGFATALGAAIADGAYGATAGFGLTFISTFLTSHAWSIKLVGGSFLLYLGIKTLLSRPKNQLVMSSNKNSFLRAFSTTFFLTLTNPLTIISYLAIFAGLGLGNVDNNYFQATEMVGGIISGSILWGLMLCTSVTLLLKRKMNASKLYWINFISGFVLALFGLGALYPTLVM